MKALISVNRTTSNTRDDYVSVVVIEAASRRTIVKLEISLEGLARAITGQSYVECEAAASPPSNASPEAGTTTTKEG